MAIKPTMEEEREKEKKILDQLAADCIEYAELWHLQPLSAHTLESFVHRVYHQGKLDGMTRGVQLMGGVK
jgi:hypothetical protein